MSREAVEPAFDSLLVRHLLALSARLGGQDSGLDNWLATSPVILDISDETTAHPVEVAFAQESGALRTICHRPYSRLRTVEEIMPVSRVRSIATGATARLAAHPEDWASHTLSGVRPSRLLGRRSEEDPVIYENRIAVAALDKMRAHLQQRLAKVSALRQMAADVHGLLMPSEHSTWRARRDLAGLLRNIENSSRRQSAAEARLEELGSALNAVEILLSSPLARTVGFRSEPPRELHPTNLFANDPDYRRIAAFWRVFTPVETPRTEAAEAAHHEEVGAAFARFTGLLLLLACTLLQATPESGQPAPGPGGVSRFQLRGESLVINWSTEGDFVVQWRDRQVLRVLPTLIDLCTAPDAATVTADVAALCRRQSNVGSVLVVYPGSQETRQSAANDVVRAAYRVGHGSDVAEPGADVAPLSPLDIFSVSRLARALNWATLGLDVRRYPPRAHVSADERSALSACGWIEPRTDGVAVVRAPRQNELDRLPNLLSQSRPRRARGKADTHHTRRLRHVVRTLEEAANATALLEVCPVCGKTDPSRPTTFEPRDEGLFTASCSSCRTRWELRRCPSCSHVFPLVTPDGTHATGAPEPDLDRRHAGSLLANPCWVQDRPGHAICPACSACSQGGRVLSCPRGCLARAQV